MISQNNPPLSIPNILNIPKINSPFKCDNFIIPPLINNRGNNGQANNSSISTNNNLQMPSLQNPTLVCMDSSNMPIISTQLNSAEDQNSSPHPDVNNKPFPLPTTKNHTTTPIKAKWTKEEDDVLKKAISKYGTNNWSLISNEIQGRTGKQCRERWLNQLNPTLNKEHWLPHEDSILTHYQAFYGNSWSKIAHFLPGRSPNSVKNRWSFLMRHNALQRARIWI